jgi:hypothetical protein
MADQMRIVMLGHSNAGKTTYMAAMYQLMNGPKGYEGFRIVANDNKRHTELLNNARAIADDRYPPPTSRHSEYDFTLSFQGRKVSSFTWNDYRGGAIMERSSSPDTGKLLKEISAADAVVVFADAYELANNPASHQDVYELTDLMHRAITAGKAKPLVLAFTKADLIRRTDQWGVAIEPFEQVMRAMETSKAVRGTTVTIACGNRPKAVEVPVLWCLSNGLANQVQALRDDIAHHQRQAAYHASRDTLGNRVSSWWNNEESEHKMQLSNLASAQRKLAELEPLGWRAQRLAKALSKAQRKNAPPRIIRKAGRR